MISLVPDCLEIPRLICLTTFPQLSWFDVEELIFICAFGVQKNVGLAFEKSNVAIIK